jgi:hypothetical protein
MTFLILLSRGRFGIFPPLKAKEEGIEALKIMI